MTPGGRPGPAGADEGRAKTRTVRIGDAWRARRDAGQPCWCGMPIHHVGWPVCGDAALPPDVEHGPRIFRNSAMTPDARYRAECWCGWGDENDRRGQRYYATERAAKIALSLHSRASAPSPAARP